MEHNHLRIGECGKHPGNGMINCPQCLMEQLWNNEKKNKEVIFKLSKKNKKKLQQLKKKFSKSLEKIKIKGYNNE